jgi:hypothetical protein
MQRVNPTVKVVRGSNYNNRLIKKIISMWHFSRNTAVTEGSHRKLKLWSCLGLVDRGIGVGY